MKQVIIILFSIAVTYGRLPKDITQSIRETMIRTGMECVSEVGASNDDVMPLVRHTVPETEKGKCFVACMHKKFKIMQADGKVDKVYLFKILEELKLLSLETYKLIKPIADKCIGKFEIISNECETATNFLECWYKEGNCGPGSDKSKRCVFEFE